MNEIRRPLKYSIIVGCLLFILSLCLALNISVYMNQRNSLYERHQAYIRDLLHFVASNMDVDDLKKCVETGQNSAVKMADDIRDYVSEILAAESALESAQNEVKRMNQLASRDALTGIRNKMAYDEELKKITRELEDGEEKFGIAIVDLNYLKRINDTFGHDKGNIAIKKLCYIVCHVFAHSPVFRIGGDEFAVILKGVDYDNVDNLIAEYYEQEDKMAKDETLESWEKISAAIGYSVFDKTVDNCVESVFKRADAAMYEKKRQMKADMM